MTVMSLFVATMVFSVPPFPASTVRKWPHTVPKRSRWRALGTAANQPAEVANSRSFLTVLQFRAVLVV